MYRYTCIAIHSVCPSFNKYIAALNSTIHSRTQPQSKIAALADRLLMRMRCASTTSIPVLPVQSQLNSVHRLSSSHTTLRFLHRFPFGYYFLLLFIAVLLTQRASCARIGIGIVIACCCRDTNPAYIFPILHFPAVSSVLHTHTLSSS